MIHVSSEFREQMEMRTDFKEQAEVTFLDGTKLSLTEDDFTVSNNSITDGAGSNGLPLGAAIQRQVQIELMNDDDHLEKYDFVGAQIRLYMTFWLPKTKELKERIEKIEYGYFTVTKPETYGQTVIVAAVDDMYRADKAFYSDLIFPVSASELFIEMCEHCGIQPGNTLFRNNDFTIKEKPSGSDLTFRAVFGYLAMLAAGNARISRRGTLEILSYDFSVFDQEEAQIQELRNFNSLKIGTEDVVITGIRMKVKGETAEEDQTFLCGEEGYLLEIDNPLVTGQEQQLVDSIGQRLIGVHLRDFSGDHIAYPLAEFMDPVYVEDRKGRKYPSILTDIDFSFFGITTFKNSAVSAIRNGSKFSSGASKTYEEARDLITKEREARDTAIENLARKLESSSGLYCTKDEQPDGSTIYYMHDKAKLSESMIIWKMTAEAIGISTDGGKTYPTGIDATGMAILNKIYVIGINAKYVNTGTLDADLVKVINLHLQDISDDKGVTLDATLNGITADVSSKYTELDGKISENSASISILPDSIKSTVKTTYIDPLTGRVSNAESDIDAAEKRIAQNEKDILSAQSSITQTASSITADVSAKYKELDGKISDNSASISLLPDSITSTVKMTYIDPLTTRMESAEASIKINEQGIESKVSKGSIISTINQSEETITISARKIDFNGSATFTNAVANASNALSTAQNASNSVTDLSNGLSNGKTVVTGECIQTGTISFGTESYINKNGRFRVGPMYSTNGTQNEQGYYDDQDVCFDKAIMINYGIEIYGNNDSAEGISYIDFHSGADVTTGDSLYDFTGRLHNYLEGGISRFVFSGCQTATGTKAGTCTVAVNGTVVHSSDVSLKEDIEELTESKAVDFLMALNPVSYKYIGDANHNIHHGLIYQNVKEIVTDQALGNLALLQEYRGVDKKTYGALGYEELIADLIKAMQYSLKEIERLKAATTA